MLRKNTMAKVLLPTLLLSVGLLPAAKTFGDELRYVTTSNLNMRTAPGTSNRILLTIPKGGQLVYLSGKNGWYQVQYGGKKGYVSSAYVKTQKVETSETRPAATVKGSGSLRTTAALNIRKGPGTGYAKVGSMPKGAVVSYSEEKNGWYKVTYNGRTGYSSGKYLTPVNTNTPAPAPAAPAEGPKESATGNTVKKYITTGTLNMRSGPTKSYPIVQVLPKGAELTYFGQNGWYHVSYNGKTGYASNLHIKVVETAAPLEVAPVEKPAEAPAAEITANEVPAPENKAPEPAPAETAEPKAETPKNSEQGILRQTALYYPTTSLNLRTGPGTEHSLLLTLPKGVHVRSEETANGWHKVTYNGKTGYVSGKYLGSGTVYEVDGVIIANKGLGISSSFNPGVHPEAQSAYNTMAAAAKKAGHKLTMFSGFRSFTYQRDLFNKYVKQSGTKKAETYSARPGFSEHQTGLSFDIGGSDSSKWTSASFGDTKEGKWLAANAKEYGFILRYPKGKESITGYIYEPWHFRYVGKDLAKKITASGLTLDEYFDVVRPDYK